MTEAFHNSPGLKLRIGGEEIVIPAKIHITATLAEAINVVNGMIASISRLETATSGSQVTKEKEVLRGYINSVAGVNASDAIPQALKQVLNIEDRLQTARTKLRVN